MDRSSRAAGRLFIEWLSLPSGIKWLDVGCGTGAFTEIIKQSSGASEFVQSIHRPPRYRMRNRAKVPKASGFNSQLSAQHRLTDEHE
jgi:ubiquinone/menaquinone biosynthesis C-methylase UbiE